jgi:ribosomal protein L14E/L6E/L27E
LVQVVIIQPQDNGSKSHPFAYAIVAGIERYPLKVTRRMGVKKQEKRSRIKPFIKAVNYNHLMPTRYTLDLEGLKGVVTTTPSRRFRSVRTPRRPSRRLWRSDTPAARTDGSSLLCVCGGSIICSVRC